MFTSRSDEGYVEMAPGIRRKTLSFGGATLMCEFLLEGGAPLPTHDHPQEQTGYLVSGRVALTVGDETFVATPGDSWSIPGGTPHGAEIVEDSVAIEVFSPVREDFLPPEQAG